MKLTPTFLYSLGAVITIAVGNHLSSNQILGMASGEFSPARRTGMK